jgi:cell wall-associated NlpC family hydrolase
VTAAIETPVGRAPVIPVVLIGIGMYLAWFAVHYWGSDTKYPTDPLKAVLQGKPLPDATGQTPAAAIAGSIGSQAGGGGQAAGIIPGAASGNAISADAMRYVGQGYVWGGRADRPGDWDCSSFASYVLGHDLGLALPGGKWGDPGFPPASHGPTTLNYLLFGQPVNLGDAQPGDLVVSTVHMGIVIGGGKMISAQDPQLGTGVAGYLSGFPGGTPHVRRVSASTGTTQAPGATTAAGRGA